MADWWDHQQRWRRRWIRWHGRLQDRLEAWRQRREAAAEARAAQRRRTMDETIQHGIEQAMTRSLLSQMSGDVLERLLAEVWQQHRDELQAQALEAVRVEHAQALEDLKERLRDRAATERAQVERDADIMIEHGIRDGLATERLDYDERLANLRLGRDEARSRADLAETLLVHLIKELVGERRVYLFSGGNGVHQFPLHTLNTVLARQGWIVKAKQTISERQVACEIGPQRWAERSLFWLDTVTPGVAPEPDEDEEPPAPELPPAASDVSDALPPEGGR